MVNIGFGRRKIMLITRRILALILALSITLAFGALAEADDPVVVRVGDFTYTQSQLQRSLDSTLELSEMLQGDAPTDAQKAAQLEAVVESFVSQGVIENKLAEAGKNGFSEAEMEDLNQRVKDKMLTDDDRVTREDIDRFNV